MSDQRRLHPRKQPLQHRAELTRQRILAAAAHVFAEYGYAAGTTNRIAEQARISIGSLYQYYPNKDAILVELMLRHLDTGQAAVERLSTQPVPDSLEEILRMLVRIAIENHLDDPQLLRVMIEQMQPSVELREKIGAHQRERIAYIQHLLENHPEVGVADTYTAARLVVSTIELVVHHLIASREPVELPRFENELTAMLFGYLRASGK
ncbi:TetR/AcrR family transcriptional regulator [Nocardia sp. NPDC088792]|uniref:TetR/AcrR family transcriptional regulator n=1 Tax=Nocardia sp. NPDC088792 TaxID=3364332 RepID=UPI0037F1CC6F